MLEFLIACPYGTESSVIKIISIAKTVVRILQILIPIALIIWGTVDLGKAVIAGEEKKIQEARKPFIQRVIAAVIVFLIPWIVEFVMGYVSNGEWYDCWKKADSTLNGISSDVKEQNF